VAAGREGLSEAVGQMPGGLVACSGTTIQRSLSFSRRAATRRAPARTCRCLRNRQWPPAILLPPLQDGLHKPQQSLNLVVSAEDHRVGLPQLGVELALPLSPGEDTLLGLEVEEQRGEALNPQPLREALGGVPVATIGRDDW
jgi:hypothetical protein